MDSNGKFCNIGDTRSRTDFQFPRCRTIKLQSANTISTAALRENEYSKVASLKSKCQSALRRRRTEEGGLVVGGGEKEERREKGETKWKRFLIRLRHRCHFTMTTKYRYLTVFQERFEMRNRCWQVDSDLENFSFSSGINCESNRKKKKKKMRKVIFGFFRF